jgi:DNA repair protein RecN (Recombination protein N)
MLRELYIRNFALIEEARISFSAGLNILTGETGAGKSIVMDALGVISGGRASVDMVRTGCDRAIVEALFDVENGIQSQIATLCEQYGIEWDAQEGLVIVREIASNSKTTSRINGRIVTVQVLKQFGDLLINLHGQHEHQSLQKPEEHLSFLDVYGFPQLESLLNQVTALYSEYTDARRQLERAKMGEKERAQRIDILTFQLEEIDAAGIKPGEEERLEAEKKRLASAERRFSAVSGSYEMLYSGGHGGRQKPILEQLYQCNQQLTQVQHLDDKLKVICELVQNAYLQLEEAALELREYRDKIEFHPAKLDALEERLNTYNRLRKKYGTNAEEILAYAESLRSELQQLQHHDETILHLQTQLGKLESKLASACLQLSDTRKQIAQELERRIQSELRALMMPHTRFSIAFEEVADDRGILIRDRKVRVSSNGMDQVQFLFSPNPGEPLRPLSKIASGGELSRTMLALKTILADRGGVGTLVFDEVDAGISGRAAQAVAERLALLAKNKQVLCVTHLPQVACMADTHFLIAKTTTGNRTHTHISALTQEQQIEELARMLSGAEVTETTRRHAFEMLKFAEEVKAG